jgi:peroxiredoxin
VIGVAWSGTDAAFEEFVARHRLTFPQISDDAGAVFAYYDVASQPALVVIDPDGAVVTRFGAVESTLDDLLRDAAG